MMKDYSSGELMGAILSLQEATAAGFAKTDARFASLEAKLDAKIDTLRHDMNRGFDNVDERFDRLTSRVEALEQHRDRPASG
jgi:hypothetical protein